MSKQQKQLQLGFSDSKDEEKKPASDENDAAGSNSPESANMSTNQDEVDPKLAPPSEGSSSSVSDAPATSDDEPVDGHPLAGKTVMVVDAHALIYQVFHALYSAEMSSPAGEPVGAVHGFIRDILDLIEHRTPDFLICAFDPPGDTYRSDIYTEYKANRESMPDDLRSQISKIQDMLTALGVYVVSVPNFEADDVLATIATWADQANGNCVLVTNDKDCRQLITPRVKLLNIRKSEFYDEENLADDWGIRPDQVVDFQSMVGDAVDNVPGIPLIGPKIARELLLQFETLEGVLNNADKIKGKKRKENIVTFRDQALMSRDLVRLNRETPLEVEWQEAVPGPVDQERASQLCQEYGFRSIAERIGAISEGSPAAQTWQADYQVISNADELSKLIESHDDKNRLVIDTETTSIFPSQADVVGYALCWEAGKAYYVPVRAPEGEAVIDAEQAREILRPILESQQVEKIGQNLKYDMVVLRKEGLGLAGRLFDTMVADYLIDPGQRNHNMDELAKRYLGHETIKISELIGKGKNQKRMDEVSTELVGPYAAEDADVPMRLVPMLEEKLAQQDLESLFHDVEMPLIGVLAEMEANGINVDQAKLKALGEEFGAKIESLRTQIFETVGREFNIDSPKQLAEVLFDELELPVIKKTKTGRSTDAEVLGELANQHPLPALVVEYRQFAKLKSTYVDALIELINPLTGRIHTSFMQDVAATGRLSSKDPNLQNIPIRTETGRKIRSVFIPPSSDWQILSADYSQIELRVLAHFSGDEALQSAFANEEDIHTRVASEVADVGLDEVTSDMRRNAKAINFGIIYGQSPFGLAKALGISQEEAAAFIDAYFERYPGVDQFMNDVLDQAKRTRSVSTILGRQRPVTGVRDAEQRGDSRQRTLPERIAVNTVIQGSAADLIKLAMIAVQQRLEESAIEAKLLLQIHDELVFEVEQSQSNELADLVREEMSSVYKLAVPLRVDVKSGSNWGACDPI